MSILASLTPEQKAQLLQELLGSSSATTTIQETPAKPTSTYYNMDDAIPVTFKATLAKSDKSRDITFAQRFDHVWCKGSYQVKGPKGGLYFVGRCVMGVKKGQQVKGTLRISNQRFLELQAGQTVDGWFRPDGSKDSILIGELSGFTTA